MIPRAFMPTPCWGFARTAKTSTYAVTAVDRGYTIDCTSGTFSVTLAAAATLGSGFSFGVYNSGSGVITIDPNASETIRSSGGSATTLVISQGQGVLLMCDGAGFDAIAGAGLPISDSLFRVVGSADATKQIAFEADTQATGFTFTWDIGAQAASRTLTVPVLAGADTIATLATAQTLSGIKTFSSATPSSTSATGAVVISAGGLGVFGAINAGGAVNCLDFVVGAGAGARYGIITGGNSGAANGAGLTVQNAGTNIVFFGNKSAVAGGAYDATPYLLTSATLQATRGYASIHPTDGVGYGTGSGSTVTQATNKGTAVTLNNVCGAITLNNANLNANTSIAFTFNNSVLAATDVVILNLKSGGSINSYLLAVDSMGAGSCTLTVRNLTAGALAEALVINFAVIKSVSA